MSVVVSELVEDAVLTSDENDEKNAPSSMERLRKKHCENMFVLYFF